MSLQYKDILIPYYKRCFHFVKIWKIYISKLFFYCNGKRSSTRIILFYFRDEDISTTIKASFYTVNIEMVNYADLFVIPLIQLHNFKYVFLTNCLMCKLETHIGETEVYYK